MKLTRRETLAGAAALGAGACVTMPELQAMADAHPASGKTLSRIAFGSCAKQSKDQPIWNAVNAAEPDLFIFLGDNIYADTRDPKVMADKYAMLAAKPGFQKLRANTPVCAIWDDHDYGEDDAGADYPMKDESRRQFCDFWGESADSVRRTRDGIYAANMFGPAGQRVQIILLDTRWFRAPLRITDQRGAPGRERYLPDDDPAKTMLGEAQWAWLGQCLQEPAELRLIVSSVQVVVEGHGWERWGNFPLERQRLYDLIAGTKARGVVFLSGDRHIGALYRESQGTPYPLTEITSSGINRQFVNAREQGPNRLGELYPRVNFGTLDIDWQQGRVALALRDEEGAIQRNVSLALDALRPV